MIKELEHTFKNIQSQIRKEFENLETSKNSEISYDTWKREEGGGGKTFIIANGSFFDNCAVNFSSIYGNQLPDSALPNSLKKTIKNGYHAMGISVISHPKNPHIPTSHMNVRLFAILDKKGEIDNWWIGGGYDLTPYIPFEKDIVNWHKEAKASLEPFSSSFYKQFSENCNEYFFIPHRNERRGVGGIFFDNLSDLSLKNSLKMLKLEKLPEIICEPGRAIVAESGSTIVKVNLRKKQKLYINDGTYGTLFDGGVPNIVFPARLITNGRVVSKKLTSFDFYGPTCDSMDYMKGPFLLPNNIKENDYIELGQLGAYGLTFRTQFNGFFSDEIYEVEDNPIMSLYSQETKNQFLVA